MLQFADASVPNKFASEAEILIAPLLASDLEDALVFPHGFDESFAFVDAKRERLFRINILAGSDREQIHQRMPMIGRAGDDDVHIITLHEFAKV